MSTSAFAKHRYNTAWGPPDCGGTDRGQRFKVVYKDGLGKVRAWGYTDSESKAAQWAAQLKTHDVWKSPRIIDRGKST